MLLIQTIEFELVGFVLSLLLQTASPRGELVLLLPLPVPRQLWHLDDGNDTVDLFVQLTQFITNMEETVRVRCDVIAIAPPSFAIMLVLHLMLIWVKDRVLKVIENVWIVSLQCLGQTFALRTLGLHVILPEEALILAACADELLNET